MTRRTRASLKTRASRLRRNLKRRLRERRWLWLAAVVLGLVLVLSGPEPPPRDTSDLCAIFAERPAWHKSARRSAAAWGVPPPVLMAVIHQESAFDATARPPRRWYLWIIPGPRPSSAYGYAQAVDGTWESFRQATGREDARRHDFDDAAFFVGWYGDEVHRRAGIAKDDAYRLYLAYHEGLGGYLAGSHRKKPWLVAVAERVAERARRFERQYEGCRRSLWLAEVGRTVLLVLVLLSLLALAVLLVRRRWRRR